MRKHHLIPLTTLVVSASLLILPGLRWLVVQQAQLLFGRPQELLHDLGVNDPLARESFASATNALRRTAQRHPNDYDLQLAWTVREQSSVTRTDRLRALATRFPAGSASPREPSIYAHVLRYACQGEVRLHRKEEELFSSAVSTQPAPFAPLPFRSPAPSHLAEFDQAAVEGARIDPDNAYFPAMRAVGFFAAHRDTEALASLQLAAVKKRWDDYASQEVRGTWRLREMALGEHSVLHRLPAAASILYPYMPQLRGAVRVLVYKAIEAERSGRASEGLAIRHAVMQLGGLMRAESSNEIGSLVGIAITSMAIASPAGQKAVQWQDRPRVYADYLRRLGHPEEAQWAQAKLEAGSKSKEIVRRGMKAAPFYGRPLLGLLAWWAAGVLPLGCALWLLLMAAPLATLSRGVTTGRALALAAVALALLALLSAGVSKSCAALFLFVAAALQLAGQSGVFGNPTLVKALAFGAMAASGFLLAVVVVVLGPASRLWRRAAVAGMLLLVLYAGLVGVTAHHEAQMSSQLSLCVAHAGRYYAGLLGQHWPGQ